VTAARRDGLILAAILVLATALRFVGLPGRGEWDDDQGNELLTMLHWVRDGEVPLLGPVMALELLAIAQARSEIAAVLSGERVVTLGLDRTLADLAGSGDIVE